MKLHLDVRSTINSKAPTIDPIKYENLFIYYSDSHVVICDFESNKIMKKFKYEDVSIIKIHEQVLYICSNDIVMLDLENFDIIDVIKLSKATINNIMFYKSYILLSKISNRTTLLKNKHKVFEVSNTQIIDGLFIDEEMFGYYDSEKILAYNFNFLKMVEFESDNILTSFIFLNKLYLLKTDGELYNLSDDISIETRYSLSSAILCDEHILAISGASLIKINLNGEIISKLEINEQIGNYSGLIKEIYQNCSIQEKKRIKKNDTVFVENELDDSHLAGSVGIEDSNSGDLSQYSYDLKNEDSSIKGQSSESIQESENSNSFNNSEYDSESQDLVSFEQDLYSAMSQEGLYNADNDLTLPDYNQNNDIEDEEASVEYSVVANNILKTSDNDYLFFNSDKLYKIISFIDDLTDAVHFKDFLLVATSSGYIKVINSRNFPSGDYISTANIYKIHNSAITSIKLYQNILITGSKDKTVSIFMIIDNSDRLEIVKVFYLTGFMSFVTSAVYQDKVLAIATSDNILQIFSTSAICPNDSDPSSFSNFFASFENISTQRLHSKQINHLSITSKYIITSSTDKSSKILDFNGVVLKTISSDKILNTAFNDKYIAVCSHKAAKVITNGTFSSVINFQSRKPIISSGFYNGYLITCSDVIRVYDIDKKKCVKSYALDLVNPWAFSYPFICAENKILILADLSKEVNDKLVQDLLKMRENSLLLDKFIIDKAYDKALEVVLCSKDPSNIFKIICKGYDNDRRLDFLENIMKNGETKAKVFDVMVKNTSFKNSEIFNALIQRFFKDKISKASKENLKNTVKKHCQAIDDLYVDMIGLEFFKN